jgi:hypothetical protein
MSRHALVLTTFSNTAGNNKKWRYFSNPPIGWYLWYISQMLLLRACIIAVTMVGGISDIQETESAGL